MKESCPQVNTCRVVGPYRMTISCDHIIPNKRGYEATDTPGTWCRPSQLCYLMHSAAVLLPINCWSRPAKQNALLYMG